MLWIKEVEMVDSVDNWDLRHLFVVFQCRILEYLMRRSLQHWTKSSIIPISEGESVWRNKKAPKGGRISFLRIRQVVRISFLRIRQLVRISFLRIRYLVRISFLRIRRLRIDEVHINGSCPVPNLKKDLFARCVSAPFSHKQLTLRTGFVTSTTWKSYRFVWPQIFNQICLFPYFWSGFPFAHLRQVASSDCSSLEFPNHLGHTSTEAPLSTITRLSSVLGSQSLAVFFSFHFVHFATTLAQVYDIDFVINRVNILLVRLGIWVFDLHLVYHLCLVCSWMTVSCEMTLFPAHVAFFIVARFFCLFPCCCSCLCPCLDFDPCSFLCSCPCCCCHFCFVLAFALVLLPFPLLLVHVHRNCFSEVIHDPRLVRVQVGLDDCSQLVVVTLKLLRVHQQMVPQFLWAFSQHRADLHIIVQLCRGEIFVDVHLVFPRLPRFLKLCRIITHSRL